MIGTTLGGRYRLEEELGHGGMGTVYRAHDTVLRRDVAVKLLSNARLGTEGHSRLLREAQIVARLDHPNIVTVHDVGQHQGKPFIVMQLVEGGTLDDRRPANLHETVQIIKQVCVALEYAHQLGIIHRDLKPENVALSPDGTAKLMDFGLARSVATRITAEGTLMGTVHYMAPEQALGKELDRRADLYALGVMFYELTTGQLPFSDDSPVAVISQHLHAPVVPPRARNPEISAELNRLIVQLMAKDPVDRPGTAEQVYQFLERPDLLEASRPEGEEVSTLDRIARGRMVGREAEFSKARALWYQAVGGESQILVVSGEPGVGKTRLLREISTQAEVMGAHVLGSASYAEGGPPYSPFKRILRQALPGISQDGLDLPASVVADLLALAPEFRAQFADVPPNPSVDPQSDRHRLFESFFVMVAALSQQRPLLIYLDDAHWADSGSLGLFRHLARQVGNQPIMLLATYREIELDEGRALNDVLLDLSRQPQTTRLKLNRLTKGQSEELLAYFFQEKITPDFLEGIYRETDGNPYFIEEVCKSLVESGKLTFKDGRWHRPEVRELGIPQSVRLAIQSRISKLSADTQNVLSQAAVLGREFDFDTLVDACELEEDSVTVALEEADRAQLLDERRENGRLIFAFSHALVAAVLVEGLRILPRRRLHRRAAAALEKHDPQNYPALGMHLLEAGQTKQGVDYLIRAGDKARLLYAQQEAIHNYLQALDFAKESDDQVLAARTLMRLGVAYHNAFRFEESRRAYEQGFLYWQRAGKAGSQRHWAVAPHALRVASIAPPTLDPGYSDDLPSRSLIDQLFSGLTELSPDMSPVPGIARSWDVIDQGRTYRFHLRDDVRWSDGRPVTAGDFEFAWKRVLDPASNSPASKYLLDIRGADAFNRGRGRAEEVGVRAMGDHTLIVELESPTSYFLQLLQVSAAYPVPTHVVEAHRGQWAEPDRIVTNGPFRIQSWHEDGLTLRRNPDFHGQIEGNVAEVEVKIINDRANLYNLYDEGKLDVLFLKDLSIEQQDRARHLHASEYVAVPGLAVWYLVFDLKRPPFDDVRVRRAFSQAIDREALAEIGLRGLFAPATGGIVPPGMAGHTPHTAPRFDPEGSRELLREAGYASASDFPTIECLCHNHPNSSAPTEFLQSQWRQNLGVDVTWIFLNLSGFLSRLRESLPQIGLNGWIADYPDPDSFLRMAIRQHFSPAWVNDDYVELVERARRILDQTTRMELYAEAQRLLDRDVPVTPLLYHGGHFLLKPWIAEYPLSPMRWDYFKDVVIEPHD
jgi:ABC-type oligopeptide transport system substrate-binding subunit